MKKLSFRLSWSLILALSLSMFSASAAPTTAQERLATFKQNFAETGERQNCINTRQIRELQVIDKRHILFRLAHNHYVVNKLPRNCHSLRRGVALAYAPISMRLCSVDTVTVLDDFFSRNSLTGPRCGLGKFSQLKKRDARLPTGESIAEDLTVGQQPPGEVSVES
ncbi:MAG: hypothetical protein ACU84Q_17440 [Gammaproteobacteria bacterium]